MRCRRLCVASIVRQWRYPSCPTQGWRHRRRSSFKSELVFQRKLNLPWVERPTDHAKTSCAKGVTGLIKISMVEDIEELSAKLQGVFLVESKILVKGEIDTGCARSEDDVPTCSPESERHGSSKRTDVEPLGRRLRAIVGILSRNHVGRVSQSTRVAV